jgi:hypothetical protein
VLDEALLHPDLSGKPVSALLYKPCNPVHIYWSAT